MKRSIRAFFPAMVMALSAASPLFGQGAEPVGQGLKLTVDPLADGIALGSLALCAIGSEFLDEIMGDGGYAAPPLEAVPAWERGSMRPYSEGLDLAGDIGVVACLLLPALPALSGTDGVSLAKPIGRRESLPDWVEIGVMYGESLSAAYAAKNLLKSFIPRARPYVYDPNAPEELLLDGDSIRSFPSGHSTLAFTAASFASTMFILRNPGSPWAIPWTIACAAAASAIAVDRTESGSHYWGDVLAGAGLGIAAGTAVPLLHLRKAEAEKNGALSFSPGPAGFAVSFRY